MNKLTITQKNSVWAEIIGPFSLIRELSDYFSFEVPNYTFMKKRGKMSAWDGKIRLLKYSGGRNKLYIGLLPYLVKYINQRAPDTRIEMNLSKFYKEDMPDEQISNFITGLGLPYQLREYQEQIVREGIKEKRAVFVSATSSGKSICIYSLTKYWYENFPKESPRILIIVPSINLVTQLYTQFLEYSKKNGFPVEKLVSKRFYDSETKERETSIIISTWQSVYSLPESYLSTFDVIIFDEVHIAKAKEISKFLEKTTKALVRYGFTGTLDDEKVHHFIIEGLFGPKIDIINLSSLIESGHATNLNIYALELVHADKSHAKTYYDEISFLVNNEKRNDFILNLAKSTAGNTMILFFHIKHGKYLYEKATKEILDKKIYLIYGETEAELREKARILTNNDLEGKSLIIASIQIFSVGVDIPNLKHLILAHPTKSKIRLLQSIGRILRKDKNKNVCIFYDLGDILKYSYKQFLVRLKYYMKENLPIKVKRVVL